MCFTRLEEWKRMRKCKKNTIVNDISDINQSKSVKKKSFDFDDIDDFPIEIDNDFLSVTIDSYRLLSILLIDNNR